MGSSWLINWGSKKQDFCISCLLELSWGLPVKIIMWINEPSELIAWKILISMLKHPASKKLLAKRNLKCPTN